MSILKLSDPNLRLRVASTYTNTSKPMPVIVDLPMISDTQMASNTATTNYDTNTAFGIGESNAVVATFRSIVKPNYSSIPVNSQVLSAILKMTPVADLSSNARTMSAHRVLRNVVFNQATWNIFSTGNNWGTAGCSNNTTDYEGGVLLGSQSQPASPTLNSADSFQMTLDATEIQKFFDGTYTNNGIILFVDTQTNDLIQYASTDNATVAYRPKLTVTYIQQ